MEDGRVEIIAQAEADILEPFILWCHKGPITARVDQVELIDMSANEDEFTSFQHHLGSFFVLAFFIFWE